MTRLRKDGVPSERKTLWSPELHELFCQTIEQLQHAKVQVTPKYIVKLMNAELMQAPESFQLTRLQVASHLQQYRQEQLKAAAASRLIASSPSESPSAIVPHPEIANASLPTDNHALPATVTEATAVYHPTDGYNHFIPAYDSLNFEYAPQNDADSFLCLDLYPPSNCVYAEIANSVPCCEHYQVANCTPRWCFAEPGTESLSCVWSSN
eukprot:TRINITY_DN8209_c0_g1_i1.p1 TRINITY_DN8209_c0_g1~~TRINITY_DN8209_c0_g1_i1.p1  ORF type:complete len:239 (+),score=13.08 TRINITY_DN8209_c0_g1_i1:92-718(+)